MICFVLIMKSRTIDVGFQHVVGRAAYLFQLETQPYHGHCHLTRSERPELIIKVFSLSCL